MIRSLTRHPAVFNRWCAAAALAFLIGSMAARYAISRSSRQDLSQYYMGGVMARLAAWDALYPSPVADSQLNVGYIDGSTMKPRYALEAAARDVGDEPRFIQPPPVALLFVPLSFLSYAQAHALWIAILVGCTWVICLQAARMHTLCRREPTCVAGLLMLLIAFSPAAHRWIRVQNVSPIVGATIGAALLALVERREVRGSLALWLGALLKFATLILLPLYIVMRRWRALALFVAIAVASAAAALLIMGRAPFDEYRTVVAPTLARTNLLPQNQAIMGVIARMTHTLPLSNAWMIAINVGRVLSFVALMILIAAKPRAAWESMPIAFAAGGALVCWMLMFSPMYWEHYSAYLAPSFGWLAWEATRSRGRLVVVILAMSMLYIPTTTIARVLPDPLKAHMLASTILIFAIAISRIRTSPSPSPADDSGRC